MRKRVWGALLVLSLAIGFAQARADQPEQAASISKIDNGYQLWSHGYAKLNLVRIATELTGTLHLTGRASGGPANVMMWSRVNGQYYFSRIPALQNFQADQPTEFSIPFTSPDDPVTEVVLSVELPQGGTFQVTDLKLSGP
ncbi:hypothetical protein [Marinobacterium arenosum]|uniref:hypothetical protein n=1 Tax=Marinobacterium arenosum TaxID=2862496 RepID=UPI001C97233F|nr:hypothetical protein [Marinobacterium arenosum]